MGSPWTDGREREVRKREPFEQRRGSRSLSKDMLTVEAHLPVYESGQWATSQLGLNWACRH